MFEDPENKEMIKEIYEEKNKNFDEALFACSQIFDRSQSIDHFKDQDEGNPEDYFQEVEEDEEEEKVPLVP